MINKISFLGKAYFLDNVNKTITPEHKKRIENYARKLDKNTDVVVLGQETEQHWTYQGQKYKQNQISLDFSKENAKLKIQTPDGEKKVSIKEVKHNKELVPIYNAYIFADYNKEDLHYAPFKKQFDFTDSTKNVLIRPDNKTEEDCVDY